MPDDCLLISPRVCRLPVQVALHGGDAAEHSGLRQLREIEVSQLGLEPFHEAEAQSGLGVPTR